MVVIRKSKKVLPHFLPKNCYDQRCVSLFTVICIVTVVTGSSAQMTCFTCIAGGIRKPPQRGLVYVGKAPLGLSFNSYSKSNSICCFSNDSVVDNSIDDMAIPRYHNLGRPIIQNNTAVLGSFRPETRLFWYAHEGGRMP